MKKEPISRRTFIRTSSLAAAGAVTAGLAKNTRANETTPEPSKILNYNPKMHYRRLGKTNLMVSEVSLGGHWKNRNAGRYWDHFANDQVPPDVEKNRTDVVGACIDSGINYLDITTAAECLCYGAALKGRREKMHVGADIHNLGPRGSDRCNVKDQTRNVDECLRLLKTDYLDIWRPQAKMDGSNTDAEIQVLIETFHKLRDRGKVRHLGMSSHSRPWLEHVIATFPQFEMIIFPAGDRCQYHGGQSGPRLRPDAKHLQDRSRAERRHCHDQAVLRRQSIRELRQGQIPRHGRRQQKGKRPGATDAAMHPDERIDYGRGARNLDSVRGGERRTRVVYADAGFLAGGERMAHEHHRRTLGQTARGIRLAA